jgi:hypothetical protein
VVAEYGDYEVELDLPALRRPAVIRDYHFRVVWQNPHTRQFVHVGWLQIAQGRFRFEYAPEADLDQDFEPFTAFPDLHTPYESTALFPFFADRVASAAQPNILAALGIDPDKATPVELLARSWGRSPHDTIQIIPEPSIASDGTSTRLFLASGARHADEQHPQRVSRLISRLRPGQAVSVQPEPDNPVNRNALILEAHGQRVGWIPDYLLDELHKAIASGIDIRVKVENANGPSTPWHLRLLCRLEVGSVR